MKKELVKLILSILVTMILVKVAAAQLVLPTTLALKVNPTTPLPNSAAVATAWLSGSDTSGANFIWFLNNVRQSDSSGVDKNTLSFQTEKLGSVNTITVSVTTTIGENLRDSISFTVSDADLTWSAQNQAPTDYEGKLLPSEGTKMTVSVLPIVLSPGTKTQLNPNNLNYRWFLNNIFNSSASGLGKSVYKYSAGTNGDNLKVQISNTQNTVMVEKSVAIPVVAPKVLIFLADNAGNIIYRSAITAFVSNLGQKLTLKAVPYFFNLLPAQLTWSWFVNDKKMAETPRNPLVGSLEIPKDIVTPSNFQITITAMNPYFNAENAQNLININVK